MNLKVWIKFRNNYSKYVHQKFHISEFVNIMIQDIIILFLKINFKL